MQFSMILAVLLIPLLVAAEKNGEERHRKYTVSLPSLNLTRCCYCFA